jgi:hypothetical protein
VWGKGGLLLAVGDVEDEGGGVCAAVCGLQAQGRAWQLEDEAEGREIVWEIVTMREMEWEIVTMRGWIEELMLKGTKESRG